MRIRAFGILVTLLSLVSYCPAKTRHYYVAAEDVTWNYAPSGMDLMTGTPIPQPWASHLQWPKTRFIEYTDNTFTVRKPQPDWLGILGPVIRAEVGDEIVVDFVNRSRRPHSMHPHGLHYDKNNEGAYYIPASKGDWVSPGGHYTYHWFATAASGPGPGQPSSIVWWYHGHVAPAEEVNDGLLGPIIVTAKGKANADGSPKDVDREFVTCFMIFDQMATKPDGLFYSINGLIFGNLPGLYMKKGDRVRWYLLGMGNEIDLHTPHWHGETVTEGGKHTDVIELLPGSMKTVDMLADNPGTWMFHCHVGEHMEKGMVAVYTIYLPQKRACPMSFSGLQFWNHPEKDTVTVKNTSQKAITHAEITAEMFMAAQDLRLPFGPPWYITQLTPPGGEQTLEKRAVPPASAQTVLGWVFFPSSIQYNDGSTWRPEREGECFTAFWRDREHPELPALPPVQREINPD